ncbi:MAG: penicillin-binding protein 1C [Myxococcales bacterium]|nr:penicillin-binding protein 1C [Myxococcales bacterium]
MAVKASLAFSLAAVSAALALVGLVLARPFEVKDLAGGHGDSTRIRDSSGQLLREVVNAEGERARWAPLPEISPLVAEATIAVEDARFREHPGVDPIGVVRALTQNAREGRVVSGASTLSMQLSRKVHPHPRNLWGKATEMFDALRMERALTKDQILEQYLNRAPYGAGTMGVESASLRYFGKPSLHLSLAEAALLAGLPKGPSDLNPLRSSRGAKARQSLVLERMLATGRISKEDRDRALAEPLQFVSAPPPMAMHFTEYVRELAKGQAEVRTTLDRDLQLEVEQLVAEHVRGLSGAGVTNAAVVVLDNHRCEILTMVGSADWWDERAGRVNGATAKRQPGSALKPFTYALAFERGDSPATPVADVETRYGDPAGELFSPKNFSEEFSGPVLLGEALGRSLNVPAVRVAERVGAQALLDRLHDLGFDSLDKPAGHYGLGLTLGNGEVTLLELAQAYAALARGGWSCRATAFPHAPELRAPAFTQEVAYLVTDILSDEGMRIRAFGPNNALLLGFPAAVKTGTSTNFRDNWAIGYTERHTVAVWAGDFGGRSLNHLAGAAGAGPLFHKVMKRVTQRAGTGLPSKLEVPGGVVEVSVCAMSGKKPTARCPSRRAARVPASQAPAESCPWHRSFPVDRRNGLLAGVKCPKAHVAHRSFEALPPVYAEWQAEHGRPAPPARYSPLCPEDGLVPRAVVITYPRRGEVFLVEPGYDRATQSVQLALEVDPRPPEVTWLVNGRAVAQAGWPYHADWPLEPGRHRLEAVAGGLLSDPVFFEVR